MKRILPTFLMLLVSNLLCVDLTKQPVQPKKSAQPNAAHDVPLDRLRPGQEKEYEEQQKVQIELRLQVAAYHQKLQQASDSALSAAPDEEEERFWVPVNGQQVAMTMKEYTAMLCQ
jgi:hypothetical protein